MSFPPLPQSAELLARARARRATLRTPLPALDAALLGGLAPAITEVCGPAGMGKTQFCLTMVAIAVTADDDDGENDDGVGGASIAPRRGPPGGQRQGEERAAEA